MAKQGAAGEPEPQSGNKKLIMIMIAVVVLLLGIGGGLFLFMGGEEEQLSPEQEQAELEKQASQVGPMVNLDAFIVNILDDEESRYLKAALTIEASNDAAVMELNERLPQIKDAVLLLVGNKTFDELRDMQGKLQLRAELINRLNGILVKGKVKRIYFTDFVVQ